MERASATPRRADLMILADRVSQKMTPVLRQIYDQMAEPKCVISRFPCTPPETDEALGDRLPPLGRVGHIGGVVDGVLLLESPHITGEILHIDGGQTAAHRASG